MARDLDDSLQEDAGKIKCGETLIISVAELVNPRVFDSGDPSIL
jgi:hypothetical protein